MTAQIIQIVSAKESDLDKINQVIEAAIMKWDLPERVKRLSLPSYFYNAQDIKHLEIIVAKQAAEIIAVAGWELADIKNTPSHQAALLLHGLYVHPLEQNQGIAKKLIQAATHAAYSQHLSGILVKAHKDAVNFFINQQFKKINSKTSVNQYENLLWYALNT